MQNSECRIQNDPRYAQAVKVPNGTLEAPSAREKSNELDTASFRFASLNRISIIFFPCERSVTERSHSEFWILNSAFKKTPNGSVTPRTWPAGSFCFVKYFAKIASFDYFLRYLLNKSLWETILFASAV